MISLETVEADVGIFQGEHEALHRQLTHIIGLVKAAYMRGRHDGQMESLRAALDDLATTLVDHFEKEESSALYGSVPEQYPELRGLIERVIADHADFTKRIHALCQQVASGDRDLDQIAGSLSVLIDDLLTHEMQEKALLMRVYEGSLGVLT
jgi:iron-sulfur cluster repair protein YtfE (RIC family)